MSISLPVNGLGSKYLRSPLEIKYSASYYYGKLGRRAEWGKSACWIMPYQECYYETVTKTTTTNL
jgi:hypothetical protein